jgi:hypothetical protein
MEDLIAKFVQSVYKNIANKKQGSAWLTFLQNEDDRKTLSMFFLLDKMLTPLFALCTS